MHLERIAELTQSPLDNNHKRSKCDSVVRWNHFSKFNAQHRKTSDQAGNDESNNKRETGIEPATIRAAIERSTTKLPARRKDINTHSGHKNDTTDRLSHTQSTRPARIIRSQDLLPLRDGMHPERIAELTQSPLDNNHKRSKCDSVVRWNHFSKFNAQHRKTSDQAGNDESNNKRETGIEPATIRAAIERSTTELPARRKDINTHSAHKNDTTNRLSHTQSTRPARINRSQDLLPL
uniref:Uncharacterized protein n=1 Tax=Hyaloperonospora arabidopsidis (strain Emoy2) TaxID=559515 RepID=M4C659_HYAAE